MVQAVGSRAAALQQRHSASQASPVRKIQMPLGQAKNLRVALREQADLISSGRSHAATLEERIGELRETRAASEVDSLAALMRPALA